MQNHRYYAVINSKNEKRIFDNSKDYTLYKYKNRANVNCKGFQDMDSARQYLAEHDFRCHSPAPAWLEWDHDSPVFTEPLAQGVPAHADIYVCSQHDPATDCGVFAALISSPQYAEPYLLQRTIPAEEVRRGVSSSLEAIVQATRFAYDNGFQSVTVYTTNRCAVNWPTGEYAARSKVAMDYLRAIDDLTEAKHVEIDFVHLPWKGELPAKYCTAREAVEAVLRQNASCPA